jgi:hypothetical protein
MAELTKDLKEIARDAFNGAHPKLTTTERVYEAVSAVLSSLPRYERQPEAPAERTFTREQVRKAIIKRGENYAGIGTGAAGFAAAVLYELDPPNWQTSQLRTPAMV